MDKISSKGLAEVGFEAARDIDYGVSNDKLEEPAKDATDSRGHEDGPRSGNVGIAAFLCKMERRVVARHCPDDTNKGHEDADAAREIGTLVDVTPDFRRGREARETLILAVGSSWDENNDDDQGNDVECRSNTVDARNPFGGQRSHAAMDHHDEDGEKEDLIVLRSVVWIDNGGRSQGHGSGAVID